MTTLSTAAPLWTLLALAGAGFVTAYLSSVVGFGGGAMMMIAVLFFMPPLVAIPFHAIVQLIANGLRGILLWPQATWRVIIPFAAMLLPGALIGRSFFNELPEQLIYILIGSVVLLSLLPQRLNIRLLYAHGTRGWLCMGFVVGVLGVLVGAVGIIFAPSVAREGLQKTQIVASIAIMASLAHIMKITAFGVYGFDPLARWPEMTTTIPAIVLGTILGKRTLYRLDEHRFRQLFVLMLILLALKTILYDGIFAFWQQT